jgi:hypothetical protein
MSSKYVPLKKIIITFSIILSSHLFLRADVGRFEIITIQYNITLYYLKVDSRYDSISKDLNYFDDKGNFRQSINDRVKNCFSGREKFNLFKSLEIIELKYFKDYAGDKRLYILKSEVIHIPDELLNKFKIIKAFQANEYGYTYSEDLKTEDNEWIKNRGITKLWTFIDEDGFCKMNLYGVRYGISKKQLQFYKNQIKKIRKSTSDSEFVKMLNGMYKEKVIMIGDCSC